MLATVRVRFTFYRNCGTRLKAATQLLAYVGAVNAAPSRKPWATANTWWPYSPWLRRMYMAATVGHTFRGMIWDI